MIDLPEIACTGACAPACSNVPMSDVEQRRVSMDLGRPVEMGADGVCSALVDGRCVAHKNRPLICRLFGVAEGLECPHGCRPTGGRYLRKRIAFQLMADNGEMTVPYAPGGVTSGVRGGAAAYLTGFISRVSPVQIRSPRRLRS